MSLPFPENATCFSHTKDIACRTKPVGTGKRTVFGGTFVPIYVEARRFFNQHEVLTDIELKWNPCQQELLTTTLVDEMDFGAVVSL